MKSILTFLLLASVVANGQIHFTQKVFAFVQNTEGAGPHHSIYMQMPADSIPFWDTAIIAGKKYSVHFSPVETMPIQVGVRKSDKRMVSIKAAPDTKMYMLYFDATTENATAQEVAKSNTAAIVFTGRIKGRKITYKILTEVELE